MIKSIFSTGAIFFVLFFGATHSSAKATSFLNSEALIIVVLGTICIYFLSNPFQVIKSSVSLVITSFLGRNSKKLSETKGIILDVSNEIDSKKSIHQTGNEFIDKGMTWISIGITSEELESLIYEYMNHRMSLIDDAASSLSKLSKYPPALGMIGTVFGIVGIFGSLNQENAAMVLGPSLAVAMTATLYGLVFSNFIISPLAELVYQSRGIEERSLHACAEALRMWHQKKSAVFIKEKMDLYAEAA